MRRALIALVLLVIASTAQAQAPTSAPADSLTRVRNALLKSDLRNLVVAQETQFAMTGSYATSLEALGKRYQASKGVTIEIVDGSKEAYGAIARLAGAETTCVLNQGLPAERAPQTAAQKRKAIASGRPVCDGDVP